MKPNRVIVVGAGISGLVCAYRLKQRGHEVTVVESEPRVGGVIQTRIAGGFLCEQGPNSFQSAPEIIDIIRESDLNGELLTADARLPRYIFHRGKLQRAPMGPGGLLSSRLLSSGAKIRVLREFWLRPKRNEREETVAEFVTRRFGREVLQNLVAPFLSGIYAGDPGRLSIQSVFPILVKFETEYGSVLKGFVQSVRKNKESRTPHQLCSFRQGLHGLPLALAAGIGSDSILLNAQVEKIETRFENEKPSFTVQLNTHEERCRLEADAVVLSAPAYRSADLVAPLSETLARDLRSIDYPSLSVIHVSYHRSDVPHSLEGFGFLVPRNEGVRLLGCIWSSSLFPGRAPEGSVLLTLFAGGSGDPELASWSEARLVEMVSEDLRTTLGISAPPKVIDIHRHARAIPQYTLGHEARCQRIENELKKIPGLRLAGNYLRGVSLGDCVKQANEVVAGLF